MWVLRETSNQARFRLCLYLFIIPHLASCLSGLQQEAEAQFTPSYLQDTPAESVQERAGPLGGNVLRL